MVAKLFLMMYFAAPDCILAAVRSNSNNLQSTFDVSDVIYYENWKSSSIYCVVCYVLFKKRHQTELFQWLSLD